MTVPIDAPVEQIGPLLVTPTGVGGDTKVLAQPDKFAGRELTVFNDDGTTILRVSLSGSGGPFLPVFPKSARWWDVNLKIRGDIHMKSEGPGNVGADGTGAWLDVV